MTASRLLAIAFVLTLPAALRAQTRVFFPADKPGEGATSTLPFGGTTAVNQFLQILLPKAQLGGKRQIRAIGFAPASSMQRRLPDLSIRLQHATSSTLTTDTITNVYGFASTTQLPNIAWPVQGNAWSYLPVSFPYDPANGDLVVAITAKGGIGVGAGDPGFREDPGLQACYSTGWSFQPPRLGTLKQGAPRLVICFEADYLTTFEDSGCKGSNGKVPRLSLGGSSKLGQTFSVALADAPPSSFALLLWGFRIIGPIDLTVWGGPGCFVLPRPDLILGVPTSATGTASMAFPIPNDPKLATLDHPSVFQWLSYDPTANTFGFTTSNWGLVAIGP